MEKLFDILFIEVVKNPKMIIVFFTLFIFLMLPGFRRSIYRILQLFLYRDTTNEVSVSSSEDIDILNHRLTILEKDLTKNVLKDKRELISQELDKFIASNLATVIETNLDNPDLIKNSLLSNLKTDVQSEVKAFLSDTSIEDIQKIKYEEDEASRKEITHQSLLDTLKREASSTSMLKMIMINLFVVSTIGFLIFNIVLRPEFSMNAYIAILGLYIALGAFMLYIIKTSHYRSSVLLAIKEDASNYYKAVDYLSNIRQGTDITEHDVDIIRMILTNRSEREHKADHPYEVILKGISGSNVQFKGGKITLGRQNKDK